MRRHHATTHSERSKITLVTTEPLVPLVTECYGGRVNHRIPLPGAFPGGNHLCSNQMSARRSATLSPEQK